MIKPYNMKHIYAVGDKINHKVIGDGKVIDKVKTESGERILVDFGTKQRWMLSAYKP